MLAQLKVSSIDHRCADGTENLTREIVFVDCIHVLLLPIYLSLLARVLCFDFTSIHLEEIHRLLWMLASNIVESASGDIVCVALSHQRIVLQQILNLGSVRWCLCMQDPLRFGPKNIISIANLTAKLYILRNILKLHV